MTNNNWAAKYQHNINISEGSCGTDDWSNDAGNSALITEINYNLIHIQIENSLFQIVIIFHSFTVFKCIFDQINAACVYTYMYKCNGLICVCIYIVFHYTGQICKSFYASQYFKYKANTSLLQFLIWLNHIYYY